jgi:hypothetical protein
MTYYKKHGRRYVPIAEEMTFSALGEGYYVVAVKPGVTSTIRAIDPDYVTLTAALKEFEDVLSEKLRDASTLSLHKEWSQDDQEKRKEAHARLKTLMDEIGVDVLWQESPNDIVRAVSEALSKKALERHITIESDELILAAFKALLTRYCLKTSDTPESVMEIIKKDLVDVGVLPENVSIKLT